MFNPFKKSPITDESDSLAKESEHLYKFFQEPRFSKYYGTNVKTRLTALEQLNEKQRVIKAPGLYLLIEKAYSAQKHNAREVVLALRKELAEKFPKICDTSYFQLIFFDHHAQQEHLTLLLGKMLIRKVNSETKQPLPDRTQDFEGRAKTIFQDFKDQKPSNKGLVEAIKSEVQVLHSELSALIGGDKARIWMQDAYSYLADNYRLLEGFSFIVLIFPEELLTEQQLSALTRSQIEQMLMEKADDLERSNRRLEKEAEYTESVKKKLRQNADRLNMIIDNAMDAVILMDHKGSITYWNSMAEQVFGWSKFETIGHKLSDLIIPEGLRESHEAGLKRFLNLGKSDRLNSRIEQIGLTKSGNRIPLEISIVTNEMDDQFIFTVFIRDISSRKKHEEELLAAKEKAEKANRSKAEFLSTMSHEIRTPMNGLFGTIELLLAENPREDQKEYLGIMKHSTESLLVILNDILDFSKLEAGHIEFDIREFSLAELCGRVISTYKAGAEDKGLELKYHEESPLPELIKSDPVRLSQVLNNLISNAIKFTENGSVTLSVDIIAESEQKATARFEVSDTGVGIPKNQLKRIFDRFTQVESMKSIAQHSGTGLGLAISQKLIQMQGGKIKVSSEVGTGSKFFFELNFEKGEKVESVDEITEAKEHNLSGISVLLIEDNRVNQIVAKKMLEKWGCQVTSAYNGEEGVQTHSKQSFDIILMDLQMPIMDGIEATKIIRAKSENGDVPIIALTADVLPEIRVKVVEAGMNDIVTKPFEKEKLFYTMSSNLHSELNTPR